jgi:adenosylmethionine-8-amino-7-oxononanoate aminotransferase
LQSLLFGQWNFRSEVAIKMAIQYSNTQGSQKIVALKIAIMNLTQLAMAVNSREGSFHTKHLKLLFFESDLSTAYIEKM